MSIGTALDKICKDATRHQGRGRVARERFVARARCASCCNELTVCSLPDRCAVSSSKASPSARVRSADVGWSSSLCTLALAVDESGSLSSKAMLGKIRSAFRHFTDLQLIARHFSLWTRLGHRQDRGSPALSGE
jgi:hypothetical protein